MSRGPNGSGRELGTLGESDLSAAALACPDESAQ